MLAFAIHAIFQYFTTLAAVMSGTATTATPPTDRAATIALPGGGKSEGQNGVEYDMHFFHFLYFFCLYQTFLPPRGQDT